MTMLVQTLDILIEKAHFEPQVARAIAEAIALETSCSSAGLATRQDLAELRQATKADIAEVKSELVRWLFLTIMGQTAMMSGIMYFLLQAAR